MGERKTYLITPQKKGADVLNSHELLAELKRIQSLKKAKISSIVKQTLDELSREYGTERVRSGVRLWLVNEKIEKWSERRG